jgi:hypothetical protein
MANGTRRPRVIPVPDDVRNYVAALVRTFGLRNAAARLDLSRHATAAVALGEASRGSVAIVRESMAREAA